MPNPFDLLCLDEDGALMAPVVAKKTAPAAAATAAPPAKKASDVAAKASPQKEGRMDGERKGKEARPQTNDDAKPRAPAQPSAEEPALPDRRDRGAALRGGRHPAPPANRNFDRHSRDGRKHEGEKRQYAGKGNWGNPTDAAGEAVAAAVTGEEAPVAAAAAAEGVEGEAVERAPAASSYMTMAQFLAGQEKKKPSIAVPTMRSANDGAKIAGEVLKKSNDMYFITAKPAAAVATKPEHPQKSSAAPAKKALAGKTFSLQELNAVVPGGLARPPRPARAEESGRDEKRDAGRSSRSTEVRVNEAPSGPAFKKANINTKDEAAFPAL